MQQKERSQRRKSFVMCKTRTCFTTAAIARNTPYSIPYRSTALKAQHDFFARDCFLPCSARSSSVIQAPCQTRHFTHKYHPHFHIPAQYPTKYPFHPPNAPTIHSPCFTSLSPSESPTSVTLKLFQCQFNSACSTSATKRGSRTSSSSRGSRTTERPAALTKQSFTRATHSPSTARSQNSHIPIPRSPATLPTLSV